MTEARHPSPGGAPLWGVAAEFGDADAMLAALAGLRDRDLGRLDAFSPLPVPGAAALLRARHHAMGLIAAIGAAVAGGAMFGLCAYATIWGYRFDIGGRPLFSWPSFVVPSVSFGTLGGALLTYAGMLALCRLPRLNHPALNIPGITRASAGSYFVAVEARGDGFDPERVEAAIAALPAGPLRVHRVPR